MYFELISPRYYQNAQVARHIHFLLKSLKDEISPLGRVEKMLFFSFQMLISHNLRSQSCRKLYTSLVQDPTVR
jgi:hypothetical protein